MLDILEFEAVFHAPTDDEDEGCLLEYTDGLVSGINENRHILGGRTFFERLLELLQIKWRNIYPPSSKEQLRELHKRIASAPISLHYKHCILFYMLKDLSQLHHGPEDLATAFASNVHLEKRFWTFIEGLWELDHLQFETAVGNLTHPSIIPTFPDEIMSTLLNRRHYGAPVHESDVLPLAYYNCAHPPLAKDDVKTEFIRYMAERNVTETFFWIRARPEHEQKALLEILLDEILERSPSGGSDQEGVYSREEKAMEFVGLPLDDAEERWVDAFLTEGPGRNLRGGPDTAILRRIAMGRLQPVAADVTTKGRKHGQVNWDLLKDGLKRGLGPRKDDESPFVA
ncbi:hypothetical protein K505DRAFT_280846 [Melanomma pulvis-pyrius CBS 109.77]|uniref:ELYS-like domain-containing protein n=1 Tax=Melanomma pulvis-pyrius CBS 109.77 TaxID=1314802 RepID=A0A6A6X5A2_9PLEO|nr:hypothetical protein K505DRAFT_280846 [Melanomma pulvis-pyrius CBS 109.77]